MLEKALNGVIRKIAALFEGSAVEGERYADLQMALGVALAVLRRAGQSASDGFASGRAKARPELPDRIPVKQHKASHSTEIADSRLSSGRNAP